MPSPYGIAPLLRRHRLLLAATVIDSTGTGLILPFIYLFFLSRTSMPLTVIGSMLSLGAILTLAAPFLTGLLIDRVGAKSVVIAGNAVGALSYVAFFLVSNPLELCAVACGTSVMNAMYWTALVPLLTDVVEEERQAPLLALLRTVQDVGLGVGGIIGAVGVALFHTGGLDILIALNGASYAVALCCYALDPTGTGRNAASKESGHIPFLAFLRDRILLAILAANAVGVLCIYAFGSLFTVYVVYTLGLPRALGGVLLFLNSLLNVFLLAPVTRRAQRFRPFPVIAAGMALWVAALLLTLSAASFPAAAGAILVLVMGCFTLGEIVITPTMNIALAKSAPEVRKGQYFGVFQLSWSAGGAVAPALLTWLLATHPSLPWLLLAVAVATTGGLLLLLDRSLRRTASVGAV